MATIVLQEKSFVKCNTAAIILDGVKIVQI
jgi:hypothetical protein